MPLYVSAEAFRAGGAQRVRSKCGWRNFDKMPLYVPAEAFSQRRACPPKRFRAGGAQTVRSKYEWRNFDKCRCTCPPKRFRRGGAQTVRSKYEWRNFDKCRCSSVVEHLLGKEEVDSSILINGSEGVVGCWLIVVSWLPIAPTTKN